MPNAVGLLHFALCISHWLWLYLAWHSPCDYSAEEEHMAKDNDLNDRIAD